MAVPVASPTTISSTVLTDQNQYNGPFKSSGGAFYTVILEDTGNTLEVFKATDPDSSFTAQDTGNNPTGTPISLWVYQDGDTLDIVGQETGGDVEYHTFDMSSDAWGTTNELIESPTDSTTDDIISCSIAIRGTGDPIVTLYAGDTDRVMGTDYSRIDFNTRNGGTWSGPTLAFGAAADEINYVGSSIITGTSDGLHFFCARSSDGFLLGRTLNSSDSLSTTINNGDAVSEELRVSGASFDDGGTQRVVQPYSDFTTREPKVWRMTESSGDVADVDVVVISTVNDVDTRFNTSLMGSATNGTTMHVMWAHDTDLDLYHDNANTPQDTGDWGTDVEHRDAVTINRQISCNVYIRDTTIVLAMIYDDGGVVKYDEISLGAAAANSPTSTIFGPLYGPFGGVV